MTTPERHQEINMALAQPHQLFLVDELLKIKVGGFTSVVTFGWNNPVGRVTPVGTFSMSTKFLAETCQAILNAIEENKTEIANDQKKFIQSLK